MRRQDKLHNEELQNFYSSPNIIRMIESRRMTWEGHVAEMGEKNAYSISVRNPEGKIPLRILRCRWMDNIKMDGMDWIDLSQDW
jgi:hypothetical protein